MRRRGRGRHSGSPDTTGTYRQASYPPPEPPREERGRHRAGGFKPAGPRRMALEGRRRKRRQKQGLAGLGLAVLGTAAVAGGAFYTVKAVRDDPVPQNPILVSTGDEIETMLVFGTREQRGGAAGGATWMALAYFDPAARAGGIIYLPAHVAAEVPGRGLHPVGETLRAGGVPLLLVSIENLLGISIDNYLELSDRDVRVFFEATGPLSVEVPSEVRVSAGNGQARLLFTEGAQTLDATFLSRLLYTVGLEGDEIELGGRHLTFWDSLFKHFADQPGALGEAIKTSASAFSESDAGTAQIATTFTDLARLSLSDRTIALLPVQQVGLGGEELYSADATAIEEFMSDVLGDAVLTDSSIRVQILNGNGVPGIGQMVADRLVGEGFRVILSGNARHLNYRRTLIVTYDSSPEGQALAERARELLGVGEVQVSVQQQGIVELTIVVGKDFLRTL